MNRKEKTNVLYLEVTVVIALVLLYGYFSIQRNCLWKDNVSLWLDVVKKSPHKARVYQYLGLAFHHAGDLDRAIAEYKNSLSLNPFQADVHNNIGISYFYKGEVDKAITHFRHAIKIDPSDADAHYNLGIAYGDKGLFDLAHEEIQKGLKLRKR